MNIQMKKLVYALLYGAVITAPASAGTVSLPNLIAGPVSGNDNEAIVSELVGEEVDLVGKFEFEDGIEFEGDIDEPHFTFTPQGIEFFFASGQVKGTVDGEDWDYLAAKSGPNFFLFERTGPLTYFETDCHFLSHVSLYRAVSTPEPSSFVLGLLTLFGFWRRV